MLIEYVGDWFLIERTAEDMRRLCPSGAEVRIRRDESGLAFLVEVKVPSVAAGSQPAGAA